MIVFNYCAAMRSSVGFFYSLPSPGLKLHHDPERWISAKIRDSASLSESSGKGAGRPVSIWVTGACHQFSQALREVRQEPDFVLVGHGEINDITVKRKRCDFRDNLGSFDFLAGDPLMHGDP